MSPNPVSLRLARVPAAAFIALVLGAAALLGVVGAARPEVAVALLVLAVVVTVALAWPEAATLLFVWLIYTNALAIAVTWEGAPRTVGLLAPLLLTVPIAAGVLRGQSLRLNATMGWIVALLVAQAASTVFAVDAGVSAGELAGFVLEGVVIYFLVYNAVRTEATLQRVLWVILLAAAALSLLTAFQHFTNAPFRPFHGFGQVDSAFLQGKTDTPRYSGPLGDPNYYAQILLSAVPLGIVLCMRATSALPRLLAAGAAGMCCVGIALTFSRGAAVGLGLVLVVMIAMRMVRPRHVLAVAAAMVVVVLLVPGYADRVGSLSGVKGATAETGTEDADQSAQSRTTEMLAAALAFADRPVLGVGPGGFPIVYQTYAQQIGTAIHATTEEGDQRGEEAQREAHNMFLSVAAELGLLGLIAFCGVLWSALRSLLRARPPGRKGATDLTTALLLSLVAYIGTGLFLTLAFERYFWLLLALAGVAAACAPSREAAPARRPEPPPLDPTRQLTAPPRRALTR
jgi:putative inorganic carbon (hco3(-)) transporter